MTLLRVENLCVSIGGESVVEDVSLKLGRGEILGVIGESGSGKSLTALSIMQLLPQGAEAKGRITLEGEDLTALSEPQLCRLRGRAMGMVFQEPMTALNPLHTIGQQVAETILIHETVSRHEARARAAEALTRVELPPDRVPLSRYPHELSGGQRQRVGIAMAIALRPRLLIADEPTTGLDVTTQATVMNLIKDLATQQHMATLLITHDLALASEYCDHIVVMHAGHVVESAPTHSLFQAPRHPYTARLIAATPEPDKTFADLTPIPGNLPDLKAATLPPCRFSQRCDRYEPALCDQVPLAREHLNPEHQVACWKPL
jgi:peptide/nickel transport system ATP-binding protein